jgi:hypothetical protein
MKKYLRGERGGKSTKSGEKYYDDLVDEFWKKPGNIHNFIFYFFF